MLEKTIGPDLTTQQDAAHIIAEIINDKDYLNETQLLDTTANAIKELVEDNTASPLNRP